jgi:hypothetical protein
MDCLLQKQMTRTQLESSCASEKKMSRMSSPNTHTFIPHHSTHLNSYTNTHEHIRTSHHTLTLHTASLISHTHFTVTPHAHADALYIHSCHTRSAYTDMLTTLIAGTQLWEEKSHQSCLSLWLVVKKDWGCPRLNRGVKNDKQTSKQTESLNENHNEWKTHTDITHKGP